MNQPIELWVGGIDDGPAPWSAPSRLVGQLALWNVAVDIRTYDFAFARDASIVSLRDRVAVAALEFLATIWSVGYVGAFVDGVCDPPEVFICGGMVAHVFWFVAPRRNLVHGALEVAGIADLYVAPMRWVGDAAYPT